MPAPLCFLRLRPPDQAEWLCANRAIRRGALAELAGQTAGPRLVLIAPSEAITLRQVALPSRKRSTWTRAVPYALEDQVVEDVEALHFALGGPPDGDRLPVAVVNREVLRGWLDVCAQAGLVPVAIVPEPLLLPWREGDWSVLLEERRAVARTGRWDGFATERDVLELLLSRAMTEAGDAKPRRLRVWGHPPPTLTEAGLESRIEDSAPEPLQVFASTYQAAAVINLLQGSYSPQARWGPRLRPWRAAAALASAWLLIQGIGLAHEHWSLRREQIRLRAAMEQVYREVVPGATNIPNPRFQLETRLRELRPASVDASAFLELLYQGGQPLAGFPGVTLRGLGYRDSQMDLDLEGGNSAVLDQLRRKLDQQPGLRIEMRATQREGRVEGKVTLKRASS
ncbi:MAG: type II secretion system protein GspL [Candidatus Contendobacter sp.]|nr:type II secretion system protein GspL [Candidatus Contendobacter sp.]MDG4556200.1 type II secretion system protein GspL [Candidatus Contendobacter sp.]